MYPTTYALAHSLRSFTGSLASLTSPLAFIIARLRLACFVKTNVKIPLQQYSNKISGQVGGRVRVMSGQRSGHVRVQVTSEVRSRQRSGHVRGHVRSGQRSGQVRSGGMRLIDYSKKNDFHHSSSVRFTL